MSLIRKLREQRGLTQIQLARKVGVTSAFISSIEGNRAGIPARKVKKIANALRVPVHAIVSHEVKRFTKRYRAEVWR